MQDLFIRAIDMAVYDLMDAIRQGSADTAFLHARDAARYARQMLLATTAGESES